MSENGAGWFERPKLERTTPHRSAGHYFRTAADEGVPRGGIPLNSTEAAVVAAVRMAYKVAETQIDRSGRLAQRLRDAGDKVAGPHSDKRALDATERLIFRGMMTFLGWVESAASERENPLKRLAVAQYRLLGAMLGLTPSEGPKTEDGRPPRRAGARRRGDAEYGAQASPRLPVRIRHAGEQRRAVRVDAWQYAGDADPRKTIPVTFYHVERSSRTPLEGTVVIATPRSVTLTLATPLAAPPGRWRAALCDDNDEQVGHIEIVL